MVGVSAAAAGAGSLFRCDEARRLVLADDVVVLVEDSSPEPRRAVSLPILREGRASLPPVASVWVGDDEGARWGCEDFFRRWASCLDCFVS